MVDTALPTFVEDAEAEPLARRAAERRRHFTVSIDMYLVIAVGALLAIGLMMVWSTTFFLGSSPFTYFFQQARSMAIGGVIMLVLSAIDYRVWRRLAIPLMAGIVFLLTAVLIFGTTILSARRSL